MKLFRTDNSPSSVGVCVCVCVLYTALLTLLLTVCEFVSLGNLCLVITIIEEVAEVAL